MVPPFSGYAHLDVSMMGVGMSPVTTLDSNKLEEEEEESQLLKLDTKNDHEEVESDKLVESVTEKDSYAKQDEEGEVVVRRRPPKQLPPGWEKHSDEGGDIDMGDPMDMGFVGFLEPSLMISCPS